ncbi:hypothetical protein [Methyloversatilis discipulorum]|uniref:hypothetical protein n=1 Tax=Methyloversatilis discipulorum TaxID=1119528 RepID=UPI001A539D2F|nr:hypothetical protein [Methyloversatilis discipulorum]MBL8466879.1 hypothetical protein [Methyloversatilis discipulorum]
MEYLTSRDVVAPVLITVFLVWWVVRIELRALNDRLKVMQEKLGEIHHRIGLDEDDI